MSWETTVSEHPCPCGKGKIVVIDRSDDWGSSDHAETMRCDDCEQGYVYTQVRERTDRPFRWISCKAATKLEEDRARRKRKRDAATAAARKQCGGPLVQTLTPLRSRKAVWERLRRGGVWPGPFASFNRDVREHGREAAIQSLIDGSNVESVRRIIDEGA